jgi:hypothetical protein
MLEMATHPHYVPKELHAILKTEAEARGMSIASYITEVLACLQSIGTLIPNKSSINTPKNPIKRAKIQK